MKMAHQAVPQNTYLMCIYRSGNLFPIPENILKLPFAMTVSPPLPPFNSTLARVGVEDDTESEYRGPCYLLVQPSHFSDKETEAQGGETTNSRSQKELMSELGLGLRVLNSQSSVFLSCWNSW